MNSEKISKSELKEQFRFLFEALVKNPENPEVFLEELKLSAQMRGFKDFDELCKSKAFIFLEFVFENFETLNDKIQKNLKPGWKIKRLAKTDYALVLLAIYQLKSCKTPELQENLFKKIDQLAWEMGSTDKSPQFINSIVRSV